MGKNTNIPPPSYHAATGTPAYTPLVSPPFEPQYPDNNVYTVPTYPQQEPYANQNYCAVVIPQTDLEIQQDNKNRQCMYTALTVTFILVIIIKFALRAAYRA